MSITRVSINEAKPGRPATTAKSMLSPHPSAALEYWFFKVNAGSTALLVDWIARRRANEQRLRVSIHSPHKREVLFEKRTVLMSDGHNFLSGRRTVGRLGAVSWELDIDPGADWIAPDLFPSRLLRMPDLAGVSAPLATFTGWIRHGEHHAALQNAPGLVSHYWGRQLPSEWWWVSASQFEATVGGIGSGRSLHVGAASKCEHWRSIDLADLKRMGLLKPIVGGRIKAITWKRDDGGLDKLGVIPSARGIRFVKRDDEGKLAGLFVAYTYTPTMFGGVRKWFACPGCRRPARILYGVNSLGCRRCRSLKYASQSEASHWRAQRKALSIRRRVGASGDALDGPFPPKPPKMRWATYKGLQAVDAALQDQWLLGTAGVFGRFRGSVQRR